MKKTTIGSVVVLLIATGHPASAQEGCPSGAASTGHLGITIGCDCTVNAGPVGARPWQFRSPIRVVGIEPRGASAGILDPDDLIVGIDGARVTTPEGARRFAGIRPGQTTRLEVVRNGETRLVEVQPGAICPHDPRAVGSYAPGSGQAARRVGESPAPNAPMRDPGVASPSPGMVPLLADLLPEGRLGFALSCTGCGWERAQGVAGPRWHSRTPPRVYAVEPDGPAAAAGLRPGDVLLQVDGLPITAAGGIALGRAQPGRTLRITVQRAAQSLELSLVPGRPDAAGTLRNRYDGSFGSLEVNVQSSAPAAVSVNGAGTEMTIVVDGAVIRLRVPDGG